MLRRSAAGSIAVNDEDPSCSNMAQPEEGIPLENEVISRLLYQVRDNRDQRERLFQRRIKDGSEPTCELAEPVNQTVQQIELSFCGTVFEDLLKSEESEIQKRLVKKKRRDEIVVPKLEKLTINVDAPSSSSAPLSECLLAVGTILPGTVSNIERAARREAHVMARVAELKRQGLWSSNLLPLCVEPQRKTTHWDNLLKEVVYLAHEFKTERKYKKKIASKFVRGAMKRWQELDKKEELALEKDKKHAMKSCAAVAKIVKDFWAKVNKVVDAKAKNVIESRKRRALNNQLTMLIDKADKLSSIVGDGLQQSATPSVNSDVVADQEYSESDTSSDNEDTFVNAERNCTEEDVAQELDALQKDSVVEFDDFLSSLPPEYLKMLMENQKNEQNLEKTVEPGPIKEVKQEVTSKKDNSISSKRAELENLADEAMLFQPKGFSLKTTQIKTPVPPLMRGTLREYQIVGLDWLVTLYEKNLNGILADEMGLGKTIQTIALLAHLACAKYNWGPHLIIVPTSVILNWEMEFKRWCPALKIFTYYGSAKERKLKRKGWSKENAFHVCITSYKTVTTDIRIFKMKKWQYMVLDEAQNIKNFKSQRWQALLNVRSANRLLLTGTPLQNSLMELWSLMHFLMPELFASHDDFKEWFSNPLTDMMEGNVEYNAPLVRRLHQILRPFILRRLKGEVEKQLPKKTEKVIKCSLSKRQRYLYDDFMSQRSTRESLKSGNMMSVLNIIMQLRKCCNHPNLFEPRPVVSPFSFFGGSMTLPGCIMELLDQRIPLSLDLRDRMLGWNTKGISHNFYTKESRNKNSKPPLALEFFYSREVRTHPPKTIPKCSWHPISIPKIPGFRFVRAIPDKLPTAVMPPQGSLQITAANHNLGLKKRKRFAGIEDGDEENQKEPKEEGQSISTEPNPSAEEGVPAKRCKRRRGQKRHATKLLRQKEKGDSFDLAFRELIPRGAVKRIFEEREHQRQLLQANNLTDPLLYNELRCLLRNEIMPVASRYVCDLIAGKTLTKIMDERIGQDLQRVHFTVPNALCYESRTLPSPGCSSFYYHNELLQREACRFVMNDVKERDHALIANQRMLLPELRLIEYDCGKLQVLSQLLRQLYLYKHRVLIFTQMARMLDVLQAFLSFHGYQYFRLDGSTGVEQRHAMMERFNTDERIFCFILSTRSGGVGINLTGADTVIFYDSDWNPTMDAQAQDRCHRIGQTRHVAVYRLISERTIEENILKKAMQKRRLGEIAIDEAGFTPEFFKKPDNLRDLFEDETIKEAIPEEIVIPRDQQELNKAMAKCEDEQDVLAIRELQAEVKAEKAEFELIASGADLSQLDETTRDDDDYKELLDKLSPIECYAIRFLQEDKRSFYDTQLEEAEKELEQKNVETKTRLKGLVTTMEASHDDESMTFQADTLIDEEIPLPHLSNWDGINESFMLASDRLLVFVKKRGLLWSTFSEPQMKPIYMTTDRHLLVYTQLNQGYLLDMREAYSIVVWMKATKRNNGTSYRLSQIKLKFAFGTLYFWVPSHLHVPLGVKWRHILQMTFRGECESWPTQEGQHSSLNLKEAKGALLSLPPTSKKEVSDISRTPRPSRSPKVSSETAIEVLDEESTAISEYCASELRINGKIELTHEEEAAERNYFDAATEIPSFSRLERVRRFLKPNRFLVVKRSASTPLFLPSTCTSLETISEVDSSNSGFFSDVTNTEDVSCRANPNVTVAQMREQLETHSKRNPRTGLFGRFMPRSPKKTEENFSPKKLLVDQSKLDPSETMA